MNEVFAKEFWQSLYSNLADWLTANLPPILLTILVFFILVRLFTYFMGKLKKIMLNRTAKRRPETVDEDEKRVNTLMNILKQTGLIVIWSVFFMTILQKFEIDIGPILASAGIVGLAVGFGAQELVRDIISGFFILLENQVRAGDVAIINGTGGLVEKIELRTITLRDLSGVVHIFQNGKINSLSNMTKEWSAMVFDVGVAYKEDPEKVKRVMREVFEELHADEAFGPKILDKMEIFGVDAFGDSAVVVKGRIKTKPGAQWPVGREYRARLKKAFDAEGIEIPFPHRTIYWGEEISPLKLNVKDSNGKAPEE